MATVKIGCSQCRMVLQLDPKDFGKKLQCPRCRAIFRVGAPRLAEAPAPTSGGGLLRTKPILACAAVFLVAGAVVGFSQLGSDPDAPTAPAPPVAPQQSVVQVKIQPRPESGPAETIEEPAEVEKSPEGPISPAFHKPAAPGEEHRPVQGILFAGQAKNKSPVEFPVIAVAAAAPRPQANPVDPEPAPQKTVVLPMTEEQKRIKDAIRKGLAYLRKTQQADGGWTAGNYPVGYASMPALALLECGVPASDPAVQKAAAFVRARAINLTATYELGLAILFLDRLGSARDTALIQSMALRLVAGQNMQGGWTYHCPLLAAPEERELITFLKKNQPRPPLNPLHPDFPPSLVPIQQPPPRLPDPIAKLDGSPQNPIGGKKEPLLNPLNAKAPLQNPLGQDVRSGMLNPIALAKDATLFHPLGKDKKPEDNSRIIDRNLITPLQGSKPSAFIGAARSANDDADASRRQGVAKSAGLPPPSEFPPLPDNRTDKPKVVLPKSVLQPRPDQQQVPDGPPLPRDQWPAVPDFIAKLKNPAFQVDIKGKGKGKGKKAGNHRDDNSNSQFAILGLWAARRHGVPMALTLNLLDERYRTSQASSGGWEYRYVAGGGGQTAAMTCVGLLGLGVSHGSYSEVLNGANLAARPAEAKPDPARAPILLMDPAIQKGLRSLGTAIGMPANGKEKHSTQSLYFLWSVERVAVLYNLKTIGGKDWYGWGSEVLRTHQAADGSWFGHGYPGSNPTIDTCMALLFLRRANLTRDLAVPYLRVTDPGR